MDRRRFFGSLGISFASVGGLLGCRSEQVGEVLQPGQKDLSGSHAAGTETFQPLINEALGKLLARQQAGIQPVGLPAPIAPKRLCFVGLVNKSSEDLGDFKDQITEIIDTRINTSGVFEQVSRNFTQAALSELRMRPDELFLPANQRKFAAVLETQGKPFDYLLFATITSGTTRANSNTQKDYLLTLELVNIQTGTPDKESATIRKGYHKGHNWK